MTEPTVAVVVPTYRRPESLERCLRALAAQTVSPDRVVVVVRECDDETSDAVPRLQARGLRFEQAVVREAGVVAALEAGVARCTEEVIAHTDDDAAPRADWLERLRAAYAPGIGGVGGRDHIKSPAQTRVSANPIVGKLTWFGRLHGNHHAGEGTPREVAVLKGVNMSLRRELWRLDRGLRGDGAQVHWEVDVCLRARRSGSRLLYDPALQVDHFPGPRYDKDDRMRPTRQARADAEWNYAYVLGRHLPLWRLPAAAGYVIGVGTRSAPGLLTSLVQSFRRPRQAASMLRLAGALMMARASGFVAGVSKRARFSDRLGTEGTAR